MRIAKCHMCARRAQVHITFVIASAAEGPTAALLVFTKYCAVLTDSLAEAWTPR